MKDHILLAFDKVSCTLIGARVLIRTNMALQEKAISQITNRRSNI